jgi:hypothetical protein
MLCTLACLTFGLGCCNRLLNDVFTADFRGAKFYNNLGGDGAVLAQKIG